MRPTFLIALCLGSALMGCSALQPMTQEQKVAEFVRLVDEATPIERLFDVNISQNPHWPLNGDLNRPDISAMQLGCVRDYFQSQNAKYYKLEKARLYAEQRVPHLDDDIRLLKEGFATRSKAFFDALADGTHDSFKSDPTMVQLLLNPQHSELRHILLLDSTEQSSGIAKNMAYILFASLKSCGIDMQQSF